jgi:hypothetical protein
MRAALQGLCVLSLQAPGTSIANACEAAGLRQTTGSSASVSPAGSSAHDRV